MKHNQLNRFQENKKVNQKTSFEALLYSQTRQHLDKTFGDGKKNNGSNIQLQRRIQSQDTLLAPRRRNSKITRQSTTRYDVNAESSKLYTNNI